MILITYDFLEHVFGTGYAISTLEKQRTRT